MSDQPIPLRIAYAGTAPLGALVLEELVDRAVAPISVVVTRPDRPRGRHGTPQPSAVKESALRAGLPLLQPEQLQGEALERLLTFAPDVLVVCAFGEIVRPALLDRLLTVVVHPSAVPRWRGAAPVARALMAGETRLGVATLRMTAGVDEGPIGDLRWVEVPEEADAGRAYQLIAPAAAEGVLTVLGEVAAGTVKWRPQEGEPTYAAKIEPGDRVLDWLQPARAIVNRVRALSPSTGARTVLRDRELIVWRAGTADGEAGAGAPQGPGTPSLSPAGDRLFVQAGDGRVEILELQAPGGKRMPARAFLHGAGRWLAG